MKLYTFLLAEYGVSRMKSETVCALHKVCSKPLSDYVTDEVKKLNPEKVFALCGKGEHALKEHLSTECEITCEDFDTDFAGGFMRAADTLPDDAAVSVLFANMPYITAETLKGAMNSHDENRRELTVVCAPEQDGRDSARAEIYIFKASALKYILKDYCAESPKADSKGVLADISALLSGKNGRYVAEPEEMTVICDRVSLAAAEKAFNRRNIERIMAEGVTVIDIDNTYIGSNVKIGMDTVIYPGCIIEGDTQIGKACTIGAHSKLKNVSVGDFSMIEHSVLTDSTVGSNTAVGPFAYLRPNSRIGNNVKIGDFVEVKNSDIDDGTKVSHLTYVGDSDVGKHVNFGCGTVTVNYDGVNKHRTRIGDNAFIGCNTNLVAPVKVDSGAYTAAGSTITENVPENALAIARNRQINKNDWVTENKKKRK